MPRSSRPARRGKKTKTKRRSGGGGSGGTPARRKPAASSRVKGAYSQSIGSSLGRALGSALAGETGGVAGNLLGRAAGSLFTKITGFGDYKVGSNSLMGAAASDSLPMFTKSGRGTKIVHREYLFDVVTSPTIGQFNIQKVPIQPALAGSFPWLAPVAEQFEEYTLNGVIFEFKSNSYDALASTNTASGTVVMTTQYNVLNPTFTTKQAMEQYEFTCSAKPSVNLIHPVECARGESPIYTLSTRAGSATTGDLRLYDFANFYIATVGMQGASTNIGELWVSYDITFLKPRLGLSADIGDHYYLGTYATIVPLGGGNYFGTAPVLSPASDLGSVLTNGTTITIPTSYTGQVVVIYRLLYNVAQTYLAGALVNIAPSAGASFLNLFGAGPYSLVAAGNGFPTAGFTSTEVVVVKYFTCVQGGILTVNGGQGITGGATVQAADLFIIALPSTLTS